MLIVMDVVSSIINYGYWAMFFLLALGLLGAPIPDETLIVAFGGMTAQGHFNFSGALIVTFFGGLTGMLVSYSLGRHVGKPLLYRYGKWIRLTPKRLETAERWFTRYGVWSMIIGCFIPGFRHLISYMAGISRIHIRQFIIISACGVLLWGTALLAFGRACGYHWDTISEIMSPMIWRISLISIAVLGVIIGYMIWRRRRRGELNKDASGG